MPKAMSPCTLRSLANPMLKGLLLGLETKDGVLDLNARMFPCCKGVGEHFQVERDAVVRCDLRHRLVQVRDLLIAHEKTWGGQGHRSPRAVGPETEARLLLEASDTLKGYRSQAHVHHGTLETPSVLWSLALACAWRFGATVVVRTLTRRDGPSFYPERAALTGQAPLVFFIEQVGRLWEPKVANEFEALVSFAYKSNSYLWVEFARESREQGEPAASAAPGGPTLSTKSQFSRRIGALKDKRPEEYLEAACRSILDNMSRMPRAAN